jgi:hypothetical protein
MAPKTVFGRHPSPPVTVLLFGGAAAAVIALHVATNGTLGFHGSAGRSGRPEIGQLLDAFGLPRRSQLIRAAGLDRHTATPPRQCPLVIVDDCLLCCACLGRLIRKSTGQQR